MNGAIQDDDLWRRAFSANAGLFFDNQVYDYGPLLTGDGQLGPPAAADPVVMPSLSPAPTSNNTSDVGGLVPIPSTDFAAPVARQQYQHQPYVRVKIASRPALVPPAATTPVFEEPLFVQTRSSPPSQKQRIVGPAPVSPRGGANLPVLSKPVEPAEPAHEPAVEEPSLDQQDATSQRGGESFARKRDRAKLLRQQMNDGLDSLHEALVEISTSGANPSASAATSLIPTRGPRRAAVVACSAGLVRDLISSCVALRMENASLSTRLSAALAAAAAAQQQQRAGEVSSARPESGVAGDGTDQAEARKKHDDGAAHDQRGDAGVMSSKVFGQLLSLSVFGFLGPQSLEEGRKVSREWRDKCAWDCNWSNLCVSRWRLGPEQRHAEVWRVPENGDGKGKGGARAVVSPPPPPPSWRAIYGRLHRDVCVPTGAFSPCHKVIGKSVQEGVAIWVALNRRSNGMTGRSVMRHGSAGFRTTEVIELRAVVQRVDEGPVVRVHPCAFNVRKVSGLRALLSGGGGSRCSSSTGRMVTTTGMFPPVSEGEDRFSPRFAVNTGAADSSGGIGLGSWSGMVASPASGAVTPPLALFEYATVDFFIEATGCPTEADFLRLEVCVDVAVSGPAWTAAVESGGSPLLKALSVGLTETTPPLPPSSTRGLCPMGVEMGRPIKRRF